jgi:hypothetical protein
MSEQTFSLDPRDLELLRAEEPADAAARARVRSKLVGLIPMGGAGTGLPGVAKPPHAPADAASSSGLGTKYAIAAIAFVIGGVAGAALYAALLKPRTPQIVYIEAPTSPPVELPLGAPLATGTTTEAARRVPESSARPDSRPAASRGSGSQLSAERIMLDEARAALVRGDASRALALIDRHRATFANPLLGEERDAMEVQSLVNAGRFREARTRADAFHPHAPGSLFAPVVDAAVESIP